MFEKVQIKVVFSGRALSWLNSGHLYSGNHSATFSQHCQQVLCHGFSLVSMDGAAQSMDGATLGALTPT